MENIQYLSMSVLCKKHLKSSGTRCKSKYQIDNKKGNIDIPVWTRDHNNKMRKIVTDIILKKKK